MSEADKMDIALTVVELLTSKGYEVGKSSEMSNVLQLKKAKARLMRFKNVTPYQVAKFQLIDGVTTLNTVKNMVRDGRIKEHEHYVDRSGKLQITTACIKRLNSQQ